MAKTLREGCGALDPDGEGFACRKGARHEGNHKYWDGRGLAVSWSDGYARQTEAPQTCSGCAGSLRWDETLTEAGGWVCVGCYEPPRACQCEPYPLEADVPALEDLHRG